eukprot:INCI7669.4.p1 GENE.INCI7669.4~~INCI7669.4.p1  ORF type:complete len:2670 (-),score=386.36 INCI7669.4:1006-9015(-)
MSQLREQADWDDDLLLEKHLLSIYVHTEPQSRHAFAAALRHNHFNSIAAAVDAAVTISERIHELRHNQKNGSSATTDRASKPALAGSFIQPAAMLPTARIHVAGGGMTTHGPILLELGRCCRFCNFEFVGHGETSALGTDRDSVNSDCDSSAHNINSGTAPIKNSLSTSSTSMDDFHVEVSSNQRAPLEIVYIPETGCPSQLGFVKFSHFQFCRLPTQAQEQTVCPSAEVEQTDSPEDLDCSSDSDSSDSSPDDSGFHEETLDRCCAVLQWRLHTLRSAAGATSGLIRDGQLFRPRIRFHSCIFRAGERSGDGLRVTGAFDLHVERCTFSGARSTPRLRRVVDALVALHAKKCCNDCVASGGNGIWIQNSGLCAARFVKCEVRRVVGFGFWFAFGNKSIVKHQLSSTSLGDDSNSTFTVVNSSVQVRSCSIKEVIRGSGIIISTKSVDEQLVQAQLQLLETEVSQCAVAGLLVAAGVNSSVPLKMAPVLDIQVESCTFHHCRGDGLRFHVVGQKAPSDPSASIVDENGFTYRLNIVSCLIFANGGIGISIGSSSRLRSSKVTRHATALWLVQVEATTIRSNGKELDARLNFPLVDEDYLVAEEESADGEPSIGIGSGSDPFSRQVCEALCASVGRENLDLHQVKETVQCIVGIGGKSSSANLQSAYRHSSPTVNPFAPRSAAIAQACTAKSIRFSAGILLDFGSASPDDDLELCSPPFHAVLISNSISDHDIGVAVLLHDTLQYGRKPFFLRTAAQANRRPPHLGIISQNTVYACHVGIACHVTPSSSLVTNKLCSCVLVQASQNIIVDVDVGFSCLIEQAGEAPRVRDPSNVNQQTQKLSNVSMPLGIEFVSNTIDAFKVHGAYVDDTSLGSESEHQQCGVFAAIHMNLFIGLQSASSSLCVRSSARFRPAAKKSGEKPRVDDQLRTFALFGNRCSHVAETLNHQRSWWRRLTHRAGSVVAVDVSLLGLPQGDIAEYASVLKRCNILLTPTQPPPADHEAAFRSEDEVSTISLSDLVSKAASQVFFGIYPYMLQAAAGEAVHSANQNFLLQFSRVMQQNICELQDLEDKAVKRSLQCFSNQLADAATTETAQRKLASEVAAEVSALEAAASKLSSRIATAMSSQGSAASSSAPPSVVWGQSVNGEKRQGAVAALRDQIGSVYAQLTTLSRQCAKVVDDHDRARVNLWVARMRSKKAAVHAERVTAAINCLCSQLDTATKSATQPYDDRVLNLACRCLQWEWDTLHTQQSRINTLFGNMQASLGLFRSNDVSLHIAAAASTVLQAIVQYKSMWNAKSSDQLEDTSTPPVQERLEFVRTEVVKLDFSMVLDTDWVKVLCDMFAAVADIAQLLLRIAQNPGVTQCPEIAAFVLDLLMQLWATRTGNSIDGPDSIVQETSSRARGMEGYCFGLKALGVCAWLLFPELEVAFLAIGATHRLSVRVNEAVKKTIWPWERRDTECCECESTSLMEMRLEFYPPWTLRAGTWVPRKAPSPPVIHDEQQQSTCQTVAELLLPKAGRWFLSAHGVASFRCLAVSLHPLRRFVEHFVQSQRSVSHSFLKEQAHHLLTLLTTPQTVENRAGMESLWEFAAAALVAPSMVLQHVKASPNAITALIAATEGALKAVKCDCAPTNDGAQASWLQQVLDMYLLVEWCQITGHKAESTLTKNLDGFPAGISTTLLQCFLREGICDVGFARTTHFRTAPRAALLEVIGHTVARNSTSFPHSSVLESLQQLINAETLLEVKEQGILNGNDDAADRSVDFVQSRVNRVLNRCYPGFQPGASLFGRRFVLMELLDAKRSSGPGLERNAALSEADYGATDEKIQVWRAWDRIRRYDVVLRLYTTADCEGIFRHVVSVLRRLHATKDYPMFLPAFPKSVHLPDADINGSKSNAVSSPGTFEAYAVLDDAIVAVELVRTFVPVENPRQARSSDSWYGLDHLRKAIPFSEFDSRLETSDGQSEALSTGRARPSEAVLPGSPPRHANKFQCGCLVMPLGERNLTTCSLRGSHFTFADPQAKPQQRVLPEARHVLLHQAAACVAYLDRSGVVWGQPKPSHLVLFTHQKRHAGLKLTNFDSAVLLQTPRDQIPTNSNGVLSSAVNTQNAVADGSQVDCQASPSMEVFDTKENVDVVGGGCGIVFTLPRALIVVDEAASQIQLCIQNIGEFQAHVVSRKRPQSQFPTQPQENNDIAVSVEAKVDPQDSMDTTPESRPSLNVTVSDPVYGSGTQAITAVQCQFTTASAAQAQVLCNDIVEPSESTAGGNPSLLHSVGDQDAAQAAVDEGLREDSKLKVGLCSAVFDESVFSEISRYLAASATPSKAKMFRSWRQQQQQVPVNLLTDGCDVSGLTQANGLVVVQPLQNGKCAFANSPEAAAAFSLQGTPACYEADTTTNAWTLGALALWILGQDWSDTLENKSANDVHDNPTRTDGVISADQLAAAVASVLESASLDGDQRFRAHLQDFFSKTLRIATKRATASNLVLGDEVWPCHSLFETIPDGGLTEALFEHQASCFYKTSPAQLAKTTLGLRTASKLLNLFRELNQIEKSYVEALRTLIGYYKAPLHAVLEHDVSVDSLLGGLFGNIGAILNLHARLNDRLVHIARQRFAEVPTNLLYGDIGGALTLGIEGTACDQLARCSNDTSQQIVNAFHDVFGTWKECACCSSALLLSNTIK